MMKKILTVAVISALGAVSTPTLADTRINGFASIVGGGVVDGDANLFGYDKQVSFKQESLFALQLSSDLGEGLSATAQIMARGADDFATEFEWAYVSYEINDSTQINAGKLRIPFYRYSDFLDVGYAYTWARPSQTVYSLVFSTFDGVSIVNNHTIGDWDSTVQAIYGSYQGDIDLVSDGDDAALHNMMGVNWTLSYDWFTARAVYMQANTSISFENEPYEQDATDASGNVIIDELGNTVKIQALNSAIASVSAYVPEVTDKLIVKDDLGSFFGLGFSIDYNNILLDAEFTTVDVENSIVATQEQYYVSIGYRFDDITIYAMTEHSEDENDDSYQVSFPASAEVEQLIQEGYEALLESQNEIIDGLTVGFRYNFHPAAALKVNYTNFDQTNVGKRGLLSVGVNVVF